MAAPASGMFFRDYLKAFSRAAALWTDHFELVTLGTARNTPKASPLVRLATRGPRRKAGLMLMAGFHGEEPAGPLTLLHHLHHILGRARQLKVPLSIYPVVNPNGFDHHVRTTTDGSFTNAGFVHGEDATGPEVALLAADMRKFAPDVFLDLHEDDHEKRCYLYAFGDRRLAARLVETEEAFLPVARGPLLHTLSMQAVDGQIRDHHDGSAEDFMSHEGARGSFASETPTKAPMQVRMALDLALIDVCLDSVAEHRKR